MMTFPRVPSSQIRPPIPSIPPLPSTNMLPMRSGRNRFSQPVNPMMAPVAFNRQSIYLKHHYSFLFIDD